MVASYGLSNTPVVLSDVSAITDFPAPDDKHPLPVCKIVGNIGASMGDLATDVDQVPEIEKLSGTGTITPISTSAYLAPHFPDGPIAIRLRPVDFDVVDGRIKKNGQDGVAVLAGDIYTQPNAVTYVITLKLKDDSGKSIAFPDIRFNALQGTLDYTLIAPIPDVNPTTLRGAPGVGIGSITGDPAFPARLKFYSNESPQRLLGYVDVAAIDDAIDQTSQLASIAVTASEIATSAAGAAAVASNQADVSRDSSAASAAAAALSQSNTATSENNAAASKNAAAASATAADGSKTAAATSATNAAGSATAAGNSATAAANSASAADGSKTAAATSATNAATSATNASNSATAAGNSATAAANSATQAQQAAQGVVPDNAVTTVKIADSAVTSAKIADGTITASDIANLAITAAKIADGTITSAKILDGTITSAKIADGTIVTADIALLAITTALLADGSVTSAKIADGTITTADIANLAITTALLADSSVTSAKIVDGTIATSDIADGAITLAKHAANSVDSSKIVDGTITGTDIASGTITGANIQDGSIALSDLASNSVDSSKIVDGSITKTDLSANLMPADITMIQFGGNTTRAVGLGDNPFGIRIARPITLTAVYYRGITADASGSTTVELRKNGTAISGTSLPLPAANQVAGGGVTGLSVSLVAGDVLTVAITGVGTSPGKGLAADITATVV